MTVISVQSSVAFGHVGNSAAIFAMQRLGIEVWPIHTVQLSNHTGYPDWGGGPIDPDQVADVFAGLRRRGAFADTQALLSGYLGGRQLVTSLSQAVAQMKAANPAAIYCCDPVIGNSSKDLFVSDDVANAVRYDLVGLSDIATPIDLSLVG